MYDVVVLATAAPNSCFLRGAERSSNRKVTIDTRLATFGYKGKPLVDLQSHRCPALQVDTLTLTKKLP
jgi:hypothetical protein